MAMVRMLLNGRGEWKGCCGLPEPTVASILRESPKEEDSVPPKTAELVALLMKLEEPASADAQVQFIPPQLSCKGQKGEPG